MQTIQFTPKKKVRWPIVCSDSISQHQQKKPCIPTSTIETLFNFVTMFPNTITWICVAHIHFPPLPHTITVKPEMKSHLILSCWFRHFFLVLCCSVCLSFRAWLNLAASKGQPAEEQEDEAKTFQKSLAHQARGARFFHFSTRKESKRKKKEGTL